MTERILSQLTIDRRSALPIYQQLQQQLEALIVDGTWRAKEPLPSETALADRLGISVMTVRQSMAQLVHKGLIYREKGRGTFVTPQPLDHHLQRLESFTEDMHARSLTPASRILSFKRIPAPDAIAADLDIAPGTPVTHIRRLRMVDDRPVALHSAYLNYEGLTREELEAVGSLYTLLEQRGVFLTEAKETLEAIAADQDLAVLLEERRGDPLLKIVRISWSQEHIPVETVTAIYRADFYRYTIWLKR
ncbi:MAG: GntR family transcriptional regulator [Anaerolineae bacterium]|nr:GntR family transcriptional regulator [Anaerolineae bacterium]